METKISQVQEAIATYRQQLIEHPVYGQIKNLSHLKAFMEFHVYAVWDFMSLLKSLQIELTCTSLPWFPVGDADTRYLINEIVAGEESDLDAEGTRKSHFEIYLDAMKQCGADTQPILLFLENLQKHGDLEQSFEAAAVPQEARDFVRFTFEIINSKKSHLQSAVFTFGREDLIPGMFMSIVNDVHQQFPDSVNIFKYYLERHIEVDGDHHSHLALAMTANLCGQNDAKWDEALQSTIDSLKQRNNLWNGVARKINSLNTVTAD